MINFKIFEQKKSEIRSVLNGYFGVDFLIKTRKSEVMYPRQIYIYCLYIFTDIKLRGIAREAGLTDHSSVIYSVRKIRDYCKTDPRIKQEIIDIETLLE